MTAPVARVSDAIAHADRASRGVVLALMVAILVGIIAAAVVAFVLGLSWWVLHGPR